mmetsp:Transcript_73467/g.195235  ORF Transcript_73467/g.195235 Transcript_73467/m.195235 type:complete len:210 (+) Transcript_73467:200-829(+)
MPQQPALGTFGPLLGSAAVAPSLAAMASPSCSRSSSSDSSGAPSASAGLTRQSKASRLKRTALPSSSGLHQKASAQLRSASAAFASSCGGRSAAFCGAEPVELRHWLTGVRRLMETQPFSGPSPATSSKQILPAALSTSNAFTMHPSRSTSASGSLGSLPFDTTALPFTTSKTSERSFSPSAAHQPSSVGARFSRTPTPRSVPVPSIRT